MVLMALLPYTRVTALLLALEPLELGKEAAVTLQPGI